MRTTGVRLIANFRQYVREMRDAKRETKDFTAAAEAVVVSGDKMASRMDRAGESTARLRQEIVSTENTLRSLAQRFAASGDTAILREINNQRRHLNQLKDVSKLLPDLQRQGVRFGTLFGESFSDAFGKKFLPHFGTILRSPGGVAIIGGAAALMAPAIAGVIGSAVVGAAGAGGVVGGLALAARDPGVRSRAQQLGDFIMRDLIGDSGPFVQAAIDGLHRIRQAWTAMGSTIDRIFGSSRFVDELTTGALGSLNHILEGVADAVENADPVMGQLAITMNELGASIGYVFKQFGEHSEGMALGLADLTIVVDNFVRFTANWLVALSDLRAETEEWDRSIDSARYKLENLIPGLDLTADGFARGSAEAQAYRDYTLGVADAADYAVLAQAGMELQTHEAAAAFRHFSGEAKTAEERLKAVGTAESVGKQMMDQLLRSTGLLTDEMMANAQAATLLKNAHKAIFGAAIEASEANEAYAGSWDKLSESVKENGRSLSINTKEGRANRDALQALLQANNDSFIANIANGVSIEQATKKHGNRTKAIEKEADRLGLNERKTKDLIKVYGQIPRTKGTDLFVNGFNIIERTLLELYAYQRSLHSGQTLAVTRAQVRSELHGGFAGDPRAFRRASGGPIHGPGTSTSDSIPAWVSDGEYVIKASSARRLGRARLDHMNQHGQVPGFAEGGHVLGRRDWGNRLRAEVNVRGTRIPSRTEVANAVLPAFGDWPAGPGAQRGDSGIWRRIIAITRAAGFMAQAVSTYRRGDPKWHGSGRAVDFGGFNQDALAAFWAARHPLELIHRSNRRDYAYTRGRNMGSFNQGLMEAHRDHVHVAMRNGGVIGEPVFGVGRSGMSYSFGENGPEVVMPLAGGRGGASITVYVQAGYVVSERDLEDKITQTVDNMIRKARL